MKVIEETAKKLEDAINQGLAKLGATIDEVNVEVLETGGLFRKAKVRLTLEREEDATPPLEKTKKESDKKSEHAEEVKLAAKSEKTEKSAEPEKNVKQAKKAAPVKADTEKKTDKTDKAEKPEKPEKAEKTAKQPAPTKQDKTETRADVKKPQFAAPRKRTEEDKLAAAHALEFVKEMIAKMGFEGVDVTADESGEIINVTAPSGDDSLIIGRHGETLSAMSYLAETCARAEKSHIGVTVDCNGYRDRRAASLTALARRRADECVNKRRKIKLEPMERIDRRTVHNALTDDDRVYTASEGKEPYRYVVIMPKKNG